MKTKKKKPGPIAKKKKPGPKAKTKKDLINDKLKFINSEATKYELEFDDYLDLVKNAITSKHFK